MTNVSAPVAVITGGSHGVGRAIALALARQGYSIVLLHSLGGADAACAALELVRTLRPQSIALPVDVADEQQVVDAFSRVREEFSRMDVVVHGAGFLRREFVTELGVDHLDTMLGTVVRGAFLIAREAARALGPGGSIVLQSSAIVGTAIPGSAPYVASKAAVEGLTQVLAEELRDRRISVNAIAVGPTESEAAVVGGQAVADEDIGELVSFLVGPRGRWLTGQVIGRMAP